MDPYLSFPVISCLQTDIPATMSSNSTSTQSIAAQSDYGYVPTQWICILFLVLFGISTSLHLAQSILYRMWWLIPSAVTCGILELVGWAARTWSSISPLLLGPYIIQTTTTIMAPTFLIATNFLILEVIINQLGSQYSRLNPRVYKWLFLSCDFVSLSVQAVGGALASSAASDSTGNSDNGGHIMLGGIVFQMVTILAYTVLALEFFVRVFIDKPLRDIAASPAQIARASEAKANQRLRLMISCLGFMGLLIIIRSIYRTVELINGFQGRIIETEVYFNVLDGAMVTGAMYTLNFLHPGFLLRDAVSTSEEDASVTRDVFAGMTSDKSEVGFSDSTSKIISSMAN